MSSAVSPLALNSSAGTSSGPVALRLAVDLVVSKISLLQAIVKKDDDERRGKKVTEA